MFDCRHVPDGEPAHRSTNESDDGDTLQVRMSALSQDSGSSVGKSDAKRSISNIIGSKR